MHRPLRLLALGTAVAGPLLALAPGVALAAPDNVRVTQDAGGAWMSADEMGGTGTYTDDTLARCGHDRRMQNEPTLAIDPRNAHVWTAGSNDYCTVPTNHDAWTGYYRSIDAGAHWTDSLVPGYAEDESAQAQSSPLHQMALKGALAAGDPEQAWDGAGNLFYMGNNFSRGSADGNSPRTRSNFGDIWVTTYAPSDTGDTMTDGSRFVRTVLLATNTGGQGQFNDKTGLAVDQTNGNVYAAWSVFHGSGCNEIDFARSTDHGATFSAPVKVSTGFCGNQGPYMAIGPNHEVYLTWGANTGGSFGQNGTFGAAFTVSKNMGASFAKPTLALTYTPFDSGAFSGDGNRDCGDAPFACASGYTFPRFDLAGPTIAADNAHGTVVLAFPVTQSDGQGLVESAVSDNGGRTWSSPETVAPSETGHQFFPWATASNGRISLIWYDSRGDAGYDPTRPPCNNADKSTTACLNVYYASSSDGGSSWSDAAPLTTRPTNPNLEQFGGRLIPFFGDYITVSAVGDTIGAVWTDQRDAVTAAETADGNDSDGADVAGDPETGGSCTSAFNECFDGTGGLDQNIYSAAVSTT
jgi:hypothetical protein